MTLVTRAIKTKGAAGDNRQRPIRGAARGIRRERGPVGRCNFTTLPGVAHISLRICEMAGPRWGRRMFDGRPMAERRARPETRRCMAAVPYLMTVPSEHIALAGARVGRLSMYRHRAAAVRDNARRERGRPLRRPPANRGGRDRTSRGFPTCG